MSNINWLPKKSPNFENISKILIDSEKINQYTNGGPMVKKLETFFHEKLCVDDDRCVIAVTNAALGIHILAAAIDTMIGKKRQYITSDFTFPCSAQSYLIDSKIIDIDADGGPNLNMIDEDGEGLIVTNLFGHIVNIQKYVDFCAKREWPLIFDNACASYTWYENKNCVNYGDGCIISLHHTKPIGFGEGGLVILKKKYELYARQLLNFGFNIVNNVVQWNKYGLNAKMSDISASFIYDYINTNFDTIITKNKILYEYFISKIQDLKGVRLLSNYSDITPFVNCLPLIFDKCITGEHLYSLNLSGINARKYYTPLIGLTNSKYLFDHILCLPIHIDMEICHIDKYIDILKNI